MSDCERHSFSLRNVKNAWIECPFCRAERAERRVAELEDKATGVRKEYCQVVSENIGHRQHIAELERELEEARKVLRGIVPVGVAGGVFYVLINGESHKIISQEQEGVTTADEWVLTARNAGGER